VTDQLVAFLLGVNPPDCESTKSPPLEPSQASALPQLKKASTHDNISGKASSFDKLICETISERHFWCIGDRQGNLSPTNYAVDCFPAQEWNQETEFIATTISPAPWKHISLLAISMKS
jgi:hypothetical protein